MLRDFEPADQVAARLEISGKGLLRAPTAGVDVMGDGSLVPFSGSVRREELEPPRGATSSTRCDGAELTALPCEP